MKLELVAGLLCFVAAPGTLQISSFPPLAAELFCRPGSNVHIRKSDAVKEEGHMVPCIFRDGGLAWVAETQYRALSTGSLL